MKSTSEPNASQDSSRILVNLDQAANLLSISRRKLEELLTDGRGPCPKKIGSRILFSVKELEVWAESLQEV
jgi:excisionase family DNA binding protein